MPSLKARGLLGRGGSKEGQGERLPVGVGDSWGGGSGFDGSTALRCPGSPVPRSCRILLTALGSAAGPHDPTLQMGTLRAGSGRDCKDAQGLGLSWDGPN